MRLATPPPRFTLCITPQGATLTETCEDTTQPRDVSDYRNQPRGTVDLACWLAVRDAIEEELMYSMSDQPFMHLEDEDGEELTTLMLALEQTSMPWEARTLVTRWANLEDCERRWNYASAMRGDALARAGWKRALFFMHGGIEV